MHILLLNVSTMGYMLIILTKQFTGYDLSIIEIVASLTDRFDVNTGNNKMTKNENNIDLHGLSSLAELITESCTKFADKPAFSCLGQTFSFAQTYEQALNFSKYLQQHTNIKAGDRIAVQLPNLIQFPVVAYGALLAGVVLVNTNPLYTPREMQHQFKDSSAKAIVILADLLPNLTQIIDNTDIEQVIVTQATDFLMPDKRYQGEYLSLLDCLEQGAKVESLTPVAGELSDLAVLQYTGGTTGLSKGAMLSQINLLANAEQSFQRFKPKCVDGEDVYICPLPLYHIYAFLVNLILAASHGAHNVLIPNPRDIDAFVKTLSAYRFTHFTGINTLFVGLCQHPDFVKLDFSSLRMTISGGTALTHSAADIWLKVTGCTISEGYGLSETSPVLCFNQPGNERLGTIGFPLVDTDLQIWDENNQAVAQGQEGEIVAKGPQVMSGYWQQEEATAKSIINGYFKTGDVGVIDEDGRIRIVDRLKDMIIVSGFNVYPNEVEDVLSRHDDILEAAVIGEPDDGTGEKVAAFVVLKPDTGLTEEDVRGFCKEHLTPYKVPKKVAFIDELPKSTVGKILRRELRSA
ncbi:AMP-binding protein [Thalassotalea euphylliae]|nr:AMP-binding protein [Thalassotalea euphylliae]